MRAPGPTALVAILVTAVLWCAPPAAAFGADGCNQSITCDSVRKTGKDATAIGFQTTASGDYSTAIGFQTTASGDYSTAMGHVTLASGNWSTATGYGTVASGGQSTAMGYGTKASGIVSTAMGVETVAAELISTAMGYSTLAAGQYSTSMGSITVASGIVSTAMGGLTRASGARSTAMGESTTASGAQSTVMGHSIEAKEDESLVNSGSIHGRSLGFVADRRLTADARPADTAALLSSVNRLQVFTHVPSANYCAHRNWTRADCDSARTTGLLAQQVATVVPAAVTTPSSLKLTKPEPRKFQNDASATARARHSPGAGATAAGDLRAASAVVLEHVQGVQSLDVHVLIAQLVGAVQAQSEQMAVQSKRIQEQSRRFFQQDKQVQEQSRRAIQQDKRIQEQSKQIQEQSKQIQEQSQRITQLDAQYSTVH